MPNKPVLPTATDQLNRYSIFSLRRQTSRPSGESIRERADRRQKESECLAGVGERQKVGHTEGRERYQDRHHD